MQYPQKLVSSPEGLSLFKLRVFHNTDEQAGAVLLLTADTDYVVFQDSSMFGNYPACTVSYCTASVPVRILTVPLLIVMSPFIVDKPMTLK